MKILTSASKIVFILITIALIGLTFMKIVDAKDFMILASMCYGFYFTQKRDDNTTNI